MRPGAADAPLRQFAAPRARRTRRARVASPSNAKQSEPRAAAGAWPNYQTMAEFRRLPYRIRPTPTGRN
eukprot:162138-Lingulodinium_polyedra.AAC.1